MKALLLHWCQFEHTLQSFSAALVLLSAGQGQAALVASCTGAVTACWFED